MNNKIITLDDIKDRSTDDIIKLYRDGYILEEYSSVTLQACPEGCVPQSNVDISYKRGLYFGITVATIWGILAGLTISYLIVKTKK